MTDVMGRLLFPTVGTATAILAIRAVVRADDRGDTT
jgi:hypothetical protein